jgi:ureidoglycolate hydrolase
MNLTTVRLSAEALKGIGWMVTPEQWVRPEPGADFISVEANMDLGLEAPCSSVALECVPRPKNLHRMERHFRTREALVALEGDAIICLAPPQEAVDGGLSGVTALRVESGQAFIMERGAWHWIPFPVGDRPARFLVIFRSGTGKDDLHFHDFREPFRVRE